MSKFSTQQRKRIEQNKEQARQKRKAKEAEELAKRAEEERLQKIANFNKRRSEEVLCKAFKKPRMKAKDVNMTK